MASKIGLTESIILQGLRNYRPYRDYYNSASKCSILWPYISRRTVARHMNKLIENGYVTFTGSRVADKGRKLGKDYTHPRLTDAGIGLFSSAGNRRGTFGYFRAKEAQELGVAPAIVLDSMRYLLHMKNRRNKVIKGFSETEVVIINAVYLHEECGLSFLCVRRINDCLRLLCEKGKLSKISQTEYKVLSHPLVKTGPESLEMMDSGCPEQYLLDTDTIPAPLLEEIALMQDMYLRGGKKRKIEDISYDAWISMGYMTYHNKMCPIEWGEHLRGVKGKMPQFKNGYLNTLRYRAEALAA